MAWYSTGKAPTIVWNQFSWRLIKVSQLFVLLFVCKLMLVTIDVVPVHPNTVDQWAHPPYSGYFDGDTSCFLFKWKIAQIMLLGNCIWGRGSSDDKSGLIGVMASIETLLERDFQPTRSVVLTFGFDEEASGTFVRIIRYSLFFFFFLNACFVIFNFTISGRSNFRRIFVVRIWQGRLCSACWRRRYTLGPLIQYFEKIWSSEPAAGFGERLGAVIASVGIAEKGYVDVRIDVSSPGGHSSLPPAHTVSLPTNTPKNS